MNGLKLQVEHVKRLLQMQGRLFTALYRIRQAIWQPDLVHAKPIKALIMWQFLFGLFAHLPKTEYKMLKKKRIIIIKNILQVF